MIGIILLLQSTLGWADPGTFWVQCVSPSERFQIDLHRPMLFYSGHSDFVLSVYDRWMNRNWFEKRLSRTGFLENTSDSLKIRQTKNRTRISLDLDWAAILSHRDWDVERETWKTQGSYSEDEMTPQGLVIQRIHYTFTRCQRLY